MSSIIRKFIYAHRTCADSTADRYTLPMPSNAGLGCAVLKILIKNILNNSTSVDSN